MFLKRNSIYSSLQQQMPDIHTGHCLKCWLVSSRAWEYVAHTSSTDSFVEPVLTSEPLNQHSLHVITEKKDLQQRNNCSKTNEISPKPDLHLEVETHCLSGTDTLRQLYILKACIRSLALKTWNHLTWNALLYILTLFLFWSFSII